MVLMLHSPGEILNSQLQIQANFVNINQTDMIAYTMYIITISEGIWTIENLNSIPQIGQHRPKSHSKRMASLGVEAILSNCGESLKLSLLSYSSNTIMATANHCRYSKKMKDWVIRSQASLWEEGSTTKWEWAAVAA